jgi:hypothetical protein
MSDDLFSALGADPPTGEPLPELEEPRLGAIKAKWTQHKGGHRPCDLCVQRVHERGVGRAPVPRPARWKRVGPNDTLLLCAEDAEIQKRKDAEAETERARRVARADEARKSHARGRK